METLITSEQTGQLWNSCAWDLNSGTSLVGYKGGQSAARTLCTVDDRLLISAAANKPLLQTWSLHKDVMLSKMVVTGTVSALSISPNGHYAVAAILNKLHIWQISTGNLLTVLRRHFQNISVVKFSSDGSHFISGGDDSLALVWSLANVISEIPLETSNTSSSSSSRGPRHTWSEHSLPITDIYCGVGCVPTAWVATCSRDMTCNIYELGSGCHMGKFIFNASIFSVTMDTCNYSLFAGLSSGDIVKVDIYQRKLNNDTSNNGGDPNRMLFKSHSTAVTCLTTNLDDSLLISGSKDCTVRVWHIASGQSIRTFKHKGQITNICVIPTPPGMLNSSQKAELPLFSTFKKHLKSSVADDCLTTDTVAMKIEGQTKGKEDLTHSHAILNTNLYTLPTIKQK